jgi:hypothetical protein
MNWNDGENEMPPTPEDLTNAVGKEASGELDRAVALIHHCVNQLTEEQLWWRPSDSMNSTANVLLHRSGSLRQWIVADRMPVSVHSRNRPLQVDSDGKCSGESFHGPPFLSMQSNASNTAPGGIGGRIPARAGGCHSKRSSIRPRWSSESCCRSSVLDAASCRSSDGNHAGVNIGQALLSEGPNMQRPYQSVH